MSGIRTSLPIPTQPWEAARAKFLEGLSEEESRHFKDATLENLFYSASTVQKRHARRSRSWTMQERLSSLIDSAADYGKALDVYSNTYGLIMCPIWGSLRIILHIAREAGKFQENIVEMLAQIGDVLPRFRIYQALFRDHERLLVALSAAYLDVLRFCVRTKDFFKRAKQSMIPLSIVLKGTWKSFRASFEESMSDFRKHSKTIEKEANLAHMIEAARRHEIELANGALQLRNQKLAKRHQILSILPSVDYQGKLSRLSNERHPGTTIWIHQTPQFISWSAPSKSDCLWVHGIPGSGKSVLAASVVNALQENTLSDATSLVCYYVIDYADVASLEPLCVISSLIQQVLQALPLDRFDESFQFPFDKHQPWPTHSICIQFLLEILRAFKSAWFIIDAIDELASEAQIVVLNLIDQLLGTSSTTVKILVTSRIEDQLIRTKLKIHKSIRITQNHIDKDIATYVREQIQTMVVPCNPLFENDRIRRKAIDGLTENAKGMFLWVRFQLYNLTEVLIEDELWKVLGDLPKDLHETYSRIIEKAANGPGSQAKLAMMQKLFRWVAMTRRPLKLQELEEAAGLEKTDAHLHTERTAINTGQRLISYCGNLLVYNEEDDTVAFAHHTIQQFLYSAPENIAAQTSSSSSMKCTIRFLSELELSSAHIEIGEICLAYLDFTDFETQIVQTPKGFNLKKDEAERLVWMGVPLAVPIKDFILWTHTRSSTWKTREKCEITYTIPAAARPSESLVKKYAMLDYITTYWVFHTAHLTPESSTWVKFKRIALDRVLSFEHRPWNDQDHRLRVESVVKDLQSHIDQGQRRLIRRAAASTDWVGNDLLLYTWAVRHGICPLLPFVESNNLLPYLQLIKRKDGSEVGNFESRWKNELDAFLSNGLLSGRTYGRPGGSDGFWNGELIIRSVLEGDASTSKLLEFVVLEHSRWADESKATMKSMVRQAIILAIRVDDFVLVDGLLSYHIHTWEDLTSTLIDIIRIDPTRSQILDCVLRKTIRGQYTTEIGWQLLFVLHECLPTIESVVLQRRSGYKPHDIERVVLTLLLTTSRRPSVIDAFVKSLENGIEHLGSCDFPSFDWEPLAFSSVEVYKKIRASSQTDMLSEAKSFSRVVSVYEELEKQDIETDCNLDDQFLGALRDVFDAKTFEVDGFHLLTLVLAKQNKRRFSHWPSPSYFVVEELIPMYWTFVQDQKHKQEVLHIIDQTDINLIYVSNPLVVLLPLDILYQTLERLEQITRQGSQRLALYWLLDNAMQLNSAGVDMFMSKWLSFYSMGHSIDVLSRWEPIVRDAFREWRGIVEEW